MEPTFAMLLVLPVTVISPTLNVPVLVMSIPSKSMIEERSVLIFTLPAVMLPPADMVNVLTPDMEFALPPSITTPPAAVLSVVDVTVARPVNEFPVSVVVPDNIIFVDVSVEISPFVDVKLVTPEIELELPVNTMLPVVTLPDDSSSTPWILCMAVAPVEVYISMVPDLNFMESTSLTEDMVPLETFTVPMVAVPDVMVRPVEHVSEPVDI